MVDTGNGMRPPRSLDIMTTKLDLGGAEVQVVRIALGLAGRGWRVRVLSLAPPRAFVDELARSGVPVVDLGLTGMPALPATAVRFFRELRRHRPDVLVTFNYHANLLGKVGGRLAGIRAVVPSIRNEYFGNRLREKLEAVTARLSPITTTNSELVGEKLIARGIVPRSRLRVVFNAAADPEGPLSPARRTALREEMGAGETDLLWLAVGRFELQKDYPTLIRGFEALASGRPGARLALVGHGSLAEEVRRTAASSAAGDSIRVLGRRFDVAELMRAADAYVLSSINEGMPNTVIEAMSFGLPIVATDVGGTGELLGGGECGCLVPVSDPAALAAAMSRVMELGAEARRELGERARARLRSRHDIEAVLDRWEELCREAHAAAGRNGGAGE